MHKIQEYPCQRNYSLYKLEISIIVREISPYFLRRWQRRFDWSGLRNREEMNSNPREKKTRSDPQKTPDSTFGKTDMNIVKLDPILEERKFGLWKK